MWRLSLRKKQRLYAETVQRCVKAVAAMYYHRLELWIILIISTMSFSNSALLLPMNLPEVQAGCRCTTPLAISWSLVHTGYGSIDLRNSRRIKPTACVCYSSAGAFMIVKWWRLPATAATIELEMPRQAGPVSATSHASEVRAREIPRRIEQIREGVLDIIDKAY